MIKKWKFYSKELSRVLSGDKKVIIYPLRCSSKSIEGSGHIVIGQHLLFVKDFKKIYTERIPFIMGGSYYIAQKGSDLGIDVYKNRRGHSDPSAVAIKYLKNRFKVVGISVSKFDDISPEEWENNGLIPRALMRKAGMNADMAIVYRIELVKEGEYQQKSKQP